MEKKYATPVGVYLETSILYQLPTDVISAELLQLREACKLLDIPLVIPKTALDEWRAIRKNEFVKKMSSYENSVEKVKNAREEIKNLKEKYLLKFELPSPDSLIFPIDKETIFTGIEYMMDSHLKESGVIIAETPNISMDLLLKMSIDKTRPFEEKGEKGFRDSIILFTILEFAKKLPAGFQLLVAEDKVFDHADVHQIASDHNVKLIVVNSIQAAVDQIETFISEAIKEFRAERAELLKGFLNTHRGEILDFIRKQQSFRGLFGFKSEEGISPQNIKAITSVELLEIHNPIPGILPKGVKKDRVKISFSAKVELSLIITQSYFNALALALYGPEFEFQQESGVWKRKDEYGHFRTEDVTSTIERDLKIEASAILDKDMAQYSELQLERIV